MKKKNNLDAHTRKVLSKLFISNAEAIKKEELIKKIKSDKGKFKGAYKYLIQKFNNDKIISCLDFNKLLDEITKFKTEALLKDFVISKTEKLNIIDVQILKELEPMEAFQYMRGFLHSSKIGNFLIDEFKKKLDFEENKRRTYDLKLMRKIKEIEIVNKGKTGQLECILLANKEIKSFEESILFKDGFYTQLAHTIRESYRKQKKKLLV